MAADTQNNVHLQANPVANRSQMGCWSHSDLRRKLPAVMEGPPSATDRRRLKPNPAPPRTALELMINRCVQDEQGSIPHVVAPTVGLRGLCQVQLTRGFEAPMRSHLFRHLPDPPFPIVARHPRFDHLRSFGRFGRLAEEVFVRSAAAAHSCLKVRDFDQFLGPPVP